MRFVSFALLGFLSIGFSTAFGQSAAPRDLSDVARIRGAEHAEVVRIVNDAFLSSDTARMEMVCNEITRNNKLQGRNRAWMLSLQARMYLADRQYAASLASVEEGLVHLDQDTTVFIGCDSTRNSLLDLRATLDIREDRNEQALATLVQIEQYRRASCDERTVLSVLTRKASLLGKMRRFEELDTAATEGAAIAIRLGLPDHEGSFYLERLSARFKGGDTQATVHLAEALLADVRVRGTMQSASILNMLALAKSQQSSEFLRMNQVNHERVAPPTNDVYVANEQFRRSAFESIRAHTVSLLDDAQQSWRAEALQETDDVFIDTLTVLDSMLESTDQALNETRNRQVRELSNRMRERVQGRSELAARLTRLDQQLDRREGDARRR